MFFIVLFFLLVTFILIKFRKKFKQKWCRSKVCLVGKTVIVTGANTGIGYETALEFAKRGARVILACRNEERATTARQKIVRETQNENVVVQILNLSSMTSVRKFAKNILDTEERLDILVNNAGVGGLEHSMTSDGLQLLMQINYFGPTLLTMLLIDLLKKSAPSRIINVSSMIARFAKLTPENLNSYTGLVMSYSNSKLGNIFFTMRLAQLLANSNLSVFSLHPGAINSELFRKIPRFLRLIGKFILKTPEEGAQTTLHAALQQGIEHYSGRHFEECTVVPTYKTAKDEELIRTIWDQTMKLIQCEKESLKLSS
ncbi:retinol dehydrogenase 11 isoform X1 [Leptinotarsa decemlineata]|uniref:retinol dehydrogenase 11 isoform X1 n=1 Tax=Leptinotarsa decemlineata TaxID=7539 RepID=UPI003D30C093